MKALVLEDVLSLSLRDFPIEREEVLGPHDVRIKMHTVGICGSDVHYHTHGRIADFVVRAPMILGHEASGTVIEAGAEVTTLKVGDRVCMEPGIPDPNSRATRLGLYNIDPAVRFWATPPVHGILRPTVVHPAAFTLKLPANVSFAEAAMVEPLAVGVHATNSLLETSPLCRQCRRPRVPRQTLSGSPRPDRSSSYLAWVSSLKVSLSKTGAFSQK